MQNSCIHDEMQLKIQYILSAPASVQLEQVSCCCQVCPCKQVFRKVILSVLNWVAFLKKDQKKKKEIKDQGPSCITLYILN